MPLVYDNTRAPSEGGGWINRDDTTDWASSELPGLRDAANARLLQSQNRWGVADKVATAAAAIPFAAMAGPALSGLFTGGGAAGAAPWAAAADAGTGIPASMGAAGATGGILRAAAPAATKGIMGLFSSPAMNLGVGAALNLYGQHSANKAADQARADQLAANTQAIALQRQQLEAQLQNATLDRADMEKQNAALNDLKKQELDAAEEERQYQRTLTDQREARLTPYRDISTKALQKLSAMWGI